MQVERWPIGRGWNVCLAIPGRIDELTGDQAEVVIGGNRYDVCTVFTPEAQVGDWVLVHAGYSITRLDEQEAMETFTLIQQLQTPPGTTDDETRWPGDNGGAVG